MPITSLASSGNVGPVSLVVPAGSTALIKVTFNAAWANRVLITDENAKPLKQFDNPSGGSFQVDASRDKPRQIFLYGSHRNPGESEYLNDKWEHKLNLPLRKIVGWEDFGDVDYNDILAEVEISSGTK